MNDFKIFTFHTMTDGWRVEVYDLNNKLVEAFKARDGNDARTLVEAIERASPDQVMTLMASHHRR